jgi:surface protein
MNPRLLRPVSRGAGPAFPHNPDNLVLVYDTSLEPANLTVSVPVNNVTGSPNVTINWGDGTTSTATTSGFVTKTYATPGVYVVQISGSMTRLSFGGGASSTNNRLKLVRCLSFGNIGITSLTDGFRNCTNLVECPAQLPVNSAVTNLSGMFAGSSFNGDISAWNTAAVTLMNHMFFSNTAFNQPIGSWNTAAATNMSQMFNFATAFNQPIGSWNTATVQNMSQMFNFATAFNQPIGNWNTSSVTTMVNMFSSATAFNQPIGNWNVSNVAFFNSMFGSATAFTQDISNWDIRRATNLQLFSGATWGTANYNAALTAWADLADTDLQTRAITSFASAAGNTRVTVSNHGMVTGSRVNISGTTNYNGDYNIFSVTANTFDIGVPFVVNETTGTMRQRRVRGVPFSVGTNKYSAGTPATKRDVLVNTYNWAITDGGQA